MPRPAIKDGLSKHQRYRAAKKAAGLKQVRIWTFDASDPEFRARLARDIAQINRDPDEAAVAELIADIAAWPTDE